MDGPARYCWTRNKDPFLNGLTLEEFLPPSELQAWRNLQGLASDGSQDLANPSGNGVANLLKYAFNMAPNAGELAQPNIAILPPGGASGLPRIFRRGSGHLVIEFVRRKATPTPGITDQVRTGEVPTDFQLLDLTGAAIASIDATWERVTVTNPLVTAKCFGRLGIATGP